MSFINTENNEGVLFVTFNQDCSSLAVGTKHGCKLFSLQAFDKLEQIYDYANDEVCIIERLFSSSLVVLVSLSAPRKLKVYHFKKGTEICNYSYSNTILAVRLNRARLIVCLEESLYIHNIKDMKVLHTIRDTPPNPTGLCDLSVNVDNCYLAYPGSNTFGEIQIFDTVNLRAVTIITAHDNPVAAMSFNSTGTKIATASEKGTVIRIFSSTEGIKLFEFRRGMKRCVSVCSLHFSPDSLFLAVSSNTETIHVFKLEVVKDKPEMAQGLMGYVNKAVASTTNYLPTQVSEMLQQSRDFATAYLPFSGIRNICAVVSLPKSTLKLIVASYNGYLYVYNFDPILGGDCSLVKQFKFLNNADDQNNEHSPSSSSNEHYINEGGLEGRRPSGGGDFASPPRSIPPHHPPAQSSEGWGSPPAAPPTSYATVLSKSPTPQHANPSFDGGVLGEVQFVASSIDSHDSSTLPPLADLHLTTKGEGGYERGKDF